MLTKSRLFLCLAALLALPLLGYAVSYALVVFFPFSERSTPARAALTALLTVGLLLVPYWMLKLGAHIAHTRNPAEEEVRLRDLPKDKEQLHSKG